MASKLLFSNQLHRLALNSCVYRNIPYSVPSKTYQNITKFDSGTTTPVAAAYDERVAKGRLMHLVRSAGSIPKRGECRLFYDLHPHFQTITVCGLGDKCLWYLKFPRMAILP